MEFGHEFSQAELEQLRGTRIVSFVWNDTRKDRLYIDRLETGFYLCDRSYEIVP